MIDNYLQQLRRSLLIIGSVWPEPGSSAAGKRMLQLMSLFHSQGWEITAASPAAKSDFSADLEDRGMKTLATDINSSDFDDFIIKLQPSMVLFDRFIVEEQFGWRVAEHCPDAIRILDTEDLHCLRRARRRAVHREHPFDPRELLEDETAKREIASILRSDLSLIISDFEMDLLKNQFNLDPSLLYYLPFLVHPIEDELQQMWPTFEERSHFVTIGNFRHPPNLDAIQFAKQDVWPLIRQRLPQAEFHVYGAYPSQEVKELHQPDEGFHIRGRAEDANEVVQQARVLLAPLRFGAGLKGKLMQSMACGTPNVTTHIGAEGLLGTMSWNGIIADSAEDLASAAVRLYTRREAWHRAQEQGVRIINERFAKEHFSGGLIERVENIHLNTKQHRRNNFMGSMLMHHTAASTKYMSKWIEEKNR